LSLPDAHRSASDRALDLDGSVVRAVLRLAWPAILTSLLQTLVFLADRIMLGRFDQDALASMQIQGPVLWSVFSVFIGLTVGTIALVARSVGGGDLERARSVGRASLRLSLLLGVVVAVLGVATARPIANAMAPNEYLAGLSANYMLIAFVAFPPVFLATTAAMILNGTGDTRTPFRVGIITNTINVAISLALIFGFEVGPVVVPSLGVSGAAVGTAVSFFVGAFLLLRVLGNPNHRVSVAGWFRPNPDDTKSRRDVLGLSVPALIERVVIHTGFIAFAGVITQLGPLTMAANQAMITLESICFLGAEGFGVAAATVVGQFLGRKQPTAAGHSGWIAIGLCVLALSTFGVTIWLTAPWTLGLFADQSHGSQDLIDAGLRAMPLLAINQPLMAASVVLGHALRGAGDTRSPVISAFAGGLILRVVGAFYLGVTLDMGIVGIWLATTIDWGARTLILGTIFLRGRWKQIRV
jgi:putative MATE family efflux protein